VIAKKAGKKRDAREELLTASSMFRGMGMQLWLNKAESAGTTL